MNPPSFCPICQQALNVNNDCRNIPCISRYMTTINYYGYDGYSALLDFKDFIVRLKYNEDVLELYKPNDYQGSPTFSTTFSEENLNNLPTFLSILIAFQ